MKKGTFSERVEKSFRSSDIREIYGVVLDKEMAYRTGKAFAHFLRTKQVFVGRDNRVSSPALFKAFTKGVIEQGVDVLDLGLID